MRIKNKRKTDGEPIVKSLSTYDILKVKAVSSSSEEHTLHFSAYHIKRLRVVQPRGAITNMNRQDFNRISRILLYVGQWRTPQRYKGKSRLFFK